MERPIRGRGNRAWPASPLPTRISPKAFEFRLAGAPTSQKGRERSGPSGTLVEPPEQSRTLSNDALGDQGVPGEQSPGEIEHDAGNRFFGHACVNQGPPEREVNHC